MSITEKSDVKNDLSPRYRTKIHLCDPASQPDATGYSVTESDAIRADTSPSAKHDSAEQTIAVMTPTSTDNSTGCTDAQVSETSNSAQQ